MTAGTFVELTQSSFYWMSEGSLLELPRGSAMLEAPLSPMDLILVAKKLDFEYCTDTYERTIRQLLHQLVFWNADDSGANNTVADDIKRLSNANYFYDDSDEDPNGFIKILIAGWDGQPQNSFEYLMNRMAPDRVVPTCAECLNRNYLTFNELQLKNDVPTHVKNSIFGFILDDVFKCTKQTGITSAIYPSEKINDNHRIAGYPLYVSEIGETYKRIINA